MTNANNQSPYEIFQYSRGKTQLTYNFLPYVVSNHDEFLQCNHVVGGN